MTRVVRRKVGSTDTGRLVFMPVETAIIVGSRHNMWTVLAEAAQRGVKKYLLCRCDCGAEKQVSKAHVMSGASKGCGCTRPSRCRNLNRTHGEAGISSKSPEYQSWRAMRERCSNQKYARYELYGGRGITVCERWQNSYENFLADMGRKPTPKHSIDRINGNGNYEPNNCRWATQQEQCNNISRNVFLSAYGKTLTMAQWARELGVKPITIFCRLRRGHTHENVCRKGRLPRSLPKQTPIP